MKCWKRTFSLDEINLKCKGTMISYLGIEFADFGDDFLSATMPVTDKCIQPMGLLHGGASAVLAETVASVAGTLCTSEDYVCMGLEINCTHMNTAKLGDMLIATATPVKIGSSIQFWHIDIKNDVNQKKICSAKLSLFVKRKVF